MTFPGRRALCDWGSSRLRVFLEADGSIVQQRAGPGIGTLEGQTPFDVLRAALEPWMEQAPIQEVLLCGMVGSRNGLVEVPYVGAPLGWDAWAAGAFVLRREGLVMRLAPGVRALNFGNVPDVMRGEETQIFGALQCRTELARGRHLVALPGTHSKWVELHDGKIARIQTYITGELYALLRERSSLLRAGEPASPSPSGFEAGLARGTVARLAATLFEVRSGQLTLDRTPSWAAGFLSGLLIGDEVTDVLRSGSLDSPVTIIGDPALSALYRQALLAEGSESTELDGDMCAVAGLRLLGAPAA